MEVIPSIECRSWNANKWNLIHLAETSTIHVLIEVAPQARWREPWPRPPSALAPQIDCWRIWQPRFFQISTTLSSNNPSPLSAALYVMLSATLPSKRVGLWNIMPTKIQRESTLMLWFLRKTESTGGSRTYSVPSGMSNFPYVETYYAHHRSLPYVNRHPRQKTRPLLCLPPKKIHLYLPMEITINHKHLL